MTLFFARFWDLQTTIFPMNDDNHCLNLTHLSEPTEVWHFSRIPFQCLGDVGRFFGSETNEASKGCGTVTGETVFWFLFLGGVFF